MDEEVQSGAEEVVESPSTEEVADEQGVTELETPSGSPELTKAPDEYEREIEGLKAGIQAERTRRQTYEQMVMQFNQQQQVNQQPQTPQYNQDDFPTYGQVQGVVDKTVNDKFMQSRKTLSVMSEKIAKVNHKDYDEVIKHAADLVQKNPSLIYTIENSDDPAETAYILGRAHPEFQKRVEANIGKKVVNKINSNINQTRTLSNAGGGGNNSTNSVKRVRDMSDEEIERKIAKIKGLD